MPQSLFDRILTKSTLLLRFYTFVISTRNPLIKWLGLGLICLLCASRCWRVFVRRKLRMALLLASACALSLTLGVGVVGLSCTALYLLCLLPTLRECLVQNAGHRAGAEGFDGKYAAREFDPALLKRLELPEAAPCENTLEAARVLLQAAGGPTPPRELQYVEFDVQELIDGELVVFHDDTVTRAFSMSGANISRLKSMGFDATTPLWRLTYKQLSMLDVGGRPGVKVPTLAAMLDLLRAEQVRYPVAVEVKSLRSDAGRTRFIELCRQYKDAVTPMLDAAADAHPFPNMQWLTVIAFPHFFAASFGEFGSEANAQWCARFRAAGLWCRCCVFHFLDYLSGVE